MPRIDATGGHSGEFDPRGDLGNTLLMRDAANSAQGAIESFEIRPLGDAPGGCYGCEIMRLVGEMRGSKEYAQARRRRDDIAASQGPVLQVDVIRPRGGGGRLQGERLRGDLLFGERRDIQRDRANEGDAPAGRRRRQSRMAMFREFVGQGEACASRPDLGPRDSDLAGEGRALADGRRHDAKSGRYGARPAAAIAIQQEGHHAAVVRAGGRMLAGGKSGAGETGESENGRFEISAATPSGCGGKAGRFTMRKKPTHDATPRKTHGRAVARGEKSFVTSFAPSLPEWPRSSRIKLKTPKGLHPDLSAPAS
ncbi:MAG TPA: hypothetical protein PKA55_04765 [Rhodoblastus sp.]|nr:hypothetical protein [Rhodoblastus sp.]